MAFQVTGPQLRAIGGRGALKTDEIARAFNEFAPRFGLDREHRAEHFFAQLAHESGGFKYNKELWGPTPAQVRYEGRETLGNTQPGDGKKYKGHGLMQVTGRYNHTEFNRWIHERYPDAPDFVRYPEKLSELPWSLHAAFWYWDRHKLNELADANDLTGITRKINGGTNGLNDRRYRHGLATRALYTDSPPLPPKPGSDPRKRPTLKKGATGEDVRALQRALGIKDDGSFGPITAASVVAFQKAHNLMPDGIVGPLTWAELDKAGG